MNGHRGTRNLLIVALAVLLAGFIGSAIYWSASGVTAFLATQEEYGGAIAAASEAAGNRAIARADEQWNRVNRGARLVETHAHLLFLCILLILFAIVLAGTSLAAGKNTGLAWLATMGVLIYPGGLVAQAMDLLMFGQILSATGAVMILFFTGSVVARLLWDRPAARLPGSDQSS